MKGEDGLECVGAWVLWWCWEAQEFGELGKTRREVGEEEGAGEGVEVLDNTRGRGANRIAGEGGIKAIGREGKAGMLTNNIMA